MRRSSFPLRPHVRGLRIGIDTATLLVERPAGIEYSLLELVRHLPQVDTRNEYVLYFNFVRAQYRARLDARVRPFLSERMRACICRVPSRLMQSARQWGHWPIDATLGRCDVVHYPSFVMHPQLFGARIVTIHDLLPITHADQCTRTDVAWFRSHALRVARRADAIIAVSQYTKDVIVDLFRIPAERITVVHHGVSESFHPASAAEVADLRARLGLARPYILSVGTAEPRKNLLRLVDAFALLLQDRGADFDLVLAGKAAWGSDSLRERIAALGLEARVRVTGHIAAGDLPTLYSGATVFVMPSLAEGFGMPLLEAMACGIPVIAGNATALPEVYGDAAIGFDATDTEALAGALARVLGDSALRADLIARGLRRAEQFTWEAAARKTVAVFEAVA